MPGRPNSPICYVNGDVDRPCPAAANRHCVWCEETYDQTECMKCLDCHTGVCGSCYRRSWSRPDGSGHMETCPICAPREDVGGVRTPVYRRMASVYPHPRCDVCEQMSASITRENRLCVTCGTFDIGRTCYLWGDISAPFPAAINPLCVWCTRVYNPTDCMICPDCRTGVCNACYRQGWSRPDGSGHMETCSRCVPSETEEIREGPMYRNMTPLYPVAQCDVCGEPDASLTTENRLCADCKESEE